MSMAVTVVTAMLLQIVYASMMVNFIGLLGDILVAVTLQILSIGMHLVFQHINVSPADVIMSISASKDLPAVVR